MKRTKNSDNFKKEDLIISLLKSESNPAERNYMKHFNNNNTDDKAKGKIRNIRTMLSTLGNTVANNDRKKITKELYEKGKKGNLFDKEKGENFNYLVNLTNTLNKKEEYKYHDRDDLDYYGIRDIENLFDNDNADDDNYYKPILVKSSFKVK